jgi:hypothetical protein
MAAAAPAAAPATTAMNTATTAATTAPLGRDAASALPHPARSRQLTPRVDDRAREAEKERGEWRGDERGRRGPPFLERGPRAVS